jgi:hypothetical protein
MSAKQEEQPLAERRLAEKKLTERKDREAGLLEAVLRDKVMCGLGRPPGLLRTQVRLLWDDHYRVNVFVGEAASAKVAHSYFLKADGDGKILTSTPAIARVYGIREDPPATSITAIV